MLKQKETSKRLSILHFRIILILQQTKKLVGWQHFVHDREKKEEEKKKKRYKKALILVTDQRITAFGDENVQLISLTVKFSPCYNKIMSHNKRHIKC